MIGKPIPNPKTPFKSFRALNNYLMAKREGDNAEAKIAYADCINLVDLESATFIMDALSAQRDIRCSNPAFHCVLSWKENEVPTKEQAHEAAIITLKELGLENCHAVYGVHKDTHNYHLQMSVCRIEPDTLKAIDAGGGFTKKAMERAARRVEWSQGWEVENNAWSDIDKEGNSIDIPKFLDKPLPQKACDMENLTGEKSAMRIAKEALENKYESLKSWQEFHKMVCDNGIEYSKKGSGAILTVGDIVVKASNVSRDLSLTKLEKLYGPYEERSDKIEVNKTEAEKNIAPQPINEANKNTMWESYINTRKPYYENKKENRAKIREQHVEQKTQLREHQQEEIKKFFENCVGLTHKKFCQERSLLATKHKIERLALGDAQKEERGNFSKNNPPFPTYEQWLLRQNKLSEAEAWRHRRDNEPTFRPKIYGDEEKNGAMFTGVRGFKIVKDRRGFIFVNLETPSVISFVDLGKKLSIYRGDDSSTLAALQVASQKWGVIKINGNEEFKKRCAMLAVENGIKIDNPELQGYIKELYEEQKAQANKMYTPANELKLFKEYHNAVGADRYKVTAIEIFENGDKRGFEVNERDGAPDGFTAEEVEKKMQNLLSLKEQGKNIYYTPISVKKHYILVDGLDEDKLTYFIMDGNRPAAMIQSSPGKWQAVISIPKLGTDMDREIGNALVKKLNEKYGDPKVRGEIHRHYAPGFDNKNPKYQKRDGTFPEVELSRTEKIYCSNTLEIAKEIRDSLTEQREKEAAKMKEIITRESKDKGAASDTKTAYIAHFQDIMRVERKQGCSKPNIDANRIDVMIGIRLRATGHTKEQIRDTMEVMAPEIRKELGSAGTHPWNEYSARTANYVFSARGDKELRDKEPRFEKWKTIEKGGENASERTLTKQPQTPERKEPSRGSGISM
jgi:hypothetical protein